MLLTDYYAEVRSLIEDGLTSNTVAAYARAWKHRVEPTLGHLLLDQLKPRTIAQAQAAWSGSASTKGDALALTSRILTWAVLDEHLPANPVRSLPRKRGKAHDADPAARALTDAQTQRMLELTAWHPYGQRALAGLVFTGLRIGELVGLQSQDLDLDARIITVRRTISPNGRGVMESRQTKSGRTREVPILDDLLPWLDAALATGHEYLFTGARGGPFDSGNLTRSVRWTQIRDKIRAFPDGEASLHPHDLRHTFLMRLARLGVPPHQLQKVAGHSTVRVTELYTRIAAREAADTVRHIVDSRNREVIDPRGGKPEKALSSGF
jgi:integrase